MEFGLLGPLVVSNSGTELPVPRGHQRALLTVLLLRANRLVSVDSIADVLWEDEPPPSAPTAVRNYVRRLRQSLGEAGRNRVSTQPHGYLISVADGELDLTRFEQLLVSAQAAARDSRWEAAAAQAREALSLWRGEPLSDIESETLALREAPRLAELHLQAEELNLDAELHLGGHASAVAGLARLAAAHPLREHVQALLMLAYYRCGRQAEALAAYQRARARLVDELGAEPGTELRRMHQQVLAADPALSPPQQAKSAAPAGPGAPDGPGTGTAGSPHRDPGDGPGPGPAQRRRARIPRQLPSAVAQFTGRAAELAALQQMLGQNGDEETPGTVVISAIGGTAGVGKTALALHWAHQAASRFPDGQLYANLRGFGPGGDPAAPAEAIRAFLDALGVAPEGIPPDPAAQEGLYRSLLASRRVLIVLDNARNEQQVRPLIPASPGSLVIVTSRRQLTGLVAAHAARLLSLDVLSEAEARDMLAARIGAARAAAEPEAVAGIARLCACLPLALAITAARAAARPGFPLAALASELHDTSGRLDALDAGDPDASVRTVFSWSYRQLAPDAARMFRLLALHPGPDISLPAAASLAGAGRTQARRMLSELARAQLITEHVPGRYAFHDLLRAYAADHAASTGSEPRRRAATARMLSHYLHTADTAWLLLNPSRGTVSLAPLRAGVLPERLADHRQAMTWFEAEHRVLIAVTALAARTGFDVYAWQIPWTMAEFLDRRGHWREWVAAEDAAVAAAKRLGDRAGQATCVRHLGIAHGRLAEYDQARAHLRADLELYRELGDRYGEAQTHTDLCVVCERQGAYAEALGHAEQALQAFQAVADLEGQAHNLNNIGYIQALLGDFARAQSTCRQALRLNRELGDRRFEANSWDSLGYAEHHLGRHAQAADCYTQALSIFRELGDRYYEAKSLTHLGDMHHDAGDQDAAGVAWQQAVDILDEVAHPDADKIRAKLGALTRACRTQGPGAWTC